jgi:anti-sigma B factor antagonist
MRHALDDAPQIVVLDLSSVTFIDAAGVRAVVTAHRQAQARGAEVTIIPAPTGVHRVFELVGITASLPFAAGVRAADRGRGRARDPAGEPGARTRAA